MTCGERRGRWVRPPSRAEMADMLGWRECVLGGYPSMSTATQTGKAFIDRDRARAEDLCEVLALLRGIAKHGFRLEYHRRRSTPVFSHDDENEIVMQSQPPLQTLPPGVEWESWMEGVYYQG